MIALEPSQKELVQTGLPTGQEPDQIITYELDKLHTFTNVLFDFDEFHLPEPAKVGIAVVYKYLKENPALRIMLNGHTDTTGNESYNLLLSTRRCQAVADYMVTLGLSPDRIEWKGYGGGKPLADNSTEQGRLLNRRVEYLITN
jgi:outer membrane protein OmpA-like peptidoglycan-associated protein